MRQYSEDNFLFLIRPDPRSQGRAKPALAPREGTLGLPAWAIQTSPAPFAPPPDRTLHRATIPGLGPASAGVAAVEGQQGQAHALLLATPDLVVFAVLAASAQQRVQAAAGRGRPYRRTERRRVLAGTFAHLGRQVQGALDLHHTGQFRPAIPLGALALPPDEGAAKGTRFQPRGSDGSPGPRRKQAAFLGLSDGCLEERLGPFCSRKRSWAFWKVEGSGTLAHPRT